MTGFAVPSADGLANSSGFARAWTALPVTIFLGQIATIAPANIIPVIAQLLDVLFRQLVQFSRSGERCQSALHSRCSLIPYGWLSEGGLRYKMPRKVRDLIQELEAAGFVNRGGKGSHRNFVHPKVIKPITISGNLGDDARAYQEKAARLAIEESRK